MSQIAKEIIYNWEKNNRENKGYDLIDVGELNILADTIAKHVEKLVLEARIESLEELLVDIPNSFNENLKEILQCCNKRIGLRLVDLKAKLEKLK